MTSSVLVAGGAGHEARPGERREKHSDIVRTAGNRFSTKASA